MTTDTAILSAVRLIHIRLAERARKRRDLREEARHLGKARAALHAILRAQQEPAANRCPPR